jgi:hypothetical protein
VTAWPARARALAIALPIAPAPATTMSAPRMRALAAGQARAVKRRLGPDAAAAAATLAGLAEPEHTQ